MLKPTDKRAPVRIAVALHPDVVGDLYVYAKHIGDKPDYVVNEALKKLFDDREFEQLKKARPDLWKAETATKSKAAGA